MDLKHKGITWVGNFFQKFEAVCQEVDGFVSKDTVKYVENQLQNMGGGVKKLYSDVVQDVLPPLVEPVKQEAQAVALKSNAAISNYLKSMISYEETHVETDVKQSHMEPNAVDHVKNQLPDASSRLHLINHITPTSVDSLEEAETNSSLQKVDNVLTNENPNVGTEETAIEYSAPEVLDLISLGEKESFEASLSGEFKEDNHENAFGVLAKVSPASSFHSVEFECPHKRAAVFDSPADVTQSISDVSNILASSESGFSVVSGEKTIAEMRSIFSSSSLLAESCSLCGKSLDNSPNVVSCNNPSDHICDSSSKLSSSIPTPNVSRESKTLELGLASTSSTLSLKSLEENTSRIKEIQSLAESSGNRHIHFSESAQVINNGAFTGHSYDLGDDPSMETIELSDKVKLDESCVIVEPSELYAVARRVRKLRSYRKKIQDAFNSKKRLAEEYEQLAIWYGDADMSFGKDKWQPPLPSTPATLLDSKNSQTQLPCDSEWELL
ncbi:hypothetical protein FH972_019590 [Carpinus fangiana]|uniref:Uncharacterized protein n=1 Tax=Carpinus fangiana TaxID=176857 RepID=A0A5N6RU41_9ROSI|nr:hypothetical protein FH972_019590 [Carpinus fangiana]